MGMVPSILIRSETTGDTWRIWPESETLPPGVIHETGSYLFELRDAPSADSAELLIDDCPLEALRATAGVVRWRWSPGFHVGAVDVELRLPGSNPRRFEVVTDPDVRKLTRADFDHMVREILEDTFALFSLSSFRMGIARGSGKKRPPAIARLEFLRSRVDEFERVVASIVRAPRHVLTAEETAWPYHRAARATGPEILKSFRTGSICSEQHKPSRLPAALKGFLPGQIRVRQRGSSFDIPEHRQMGACLRAWSAWLSAAAEMLSRDDASADTQTRRERSGWAARCRRLGRRLAWMAAAAPFAEAGEAPPRLMLSALFRNDPDYRRFFRLWQDMNLGIATVFGDYLDMPLARTFELYELWAFLRIVKAAVAEYGIDPDELRPLFRTYGPGLTIASESIVINLRQSGVAIAFQRTYREFWIEFDQRGSFSRHMRPDISIETRGRADESRHLIVLDAKYRIGANLNDALSSVHMYRDALVTPIAGGGTSAIVTAAYLLSPENPSILDDWKEATMPSRLFHPLYRGAFRFGAVTLIPGMTEMQIRAALRMIIEDAKA
jgi:Domain of unknown function (DUF2357)/PD-(D/E)XK nuclease superfamily